MLLEEEKVAVVVNPCREPQATPSASFVVLRSDLDKEFCVGSEVLAGQGLELA